MKLTRRRQIDFKPIQLWTSRTKIIYTVGPKYKWPKNRRTSERQVIKHVYFQKGKIHHVIVQSSIPLSHLRMWFFGNIRVIPSHFVIFVVKTRFYNRFMWFFVRKMVQKLPFSLLIDLKTYNIHDILEGRENEIWLYHCIVAAKNIIPWSPWCQLSRTSSLFHDAVSFTWQINMWQETWQIRPKKSFEKTENLAKLLLKRAGLGENCFLHSIDDI